MVLDVHDTIAAIGTAAGPAARGMVRLSGPDCLACVARCFTPTDAEQHWQSSTVPHVVRGTFHAAMEIPGEIFLWPSQRSYTRQPTAEIHTIGSQPLLDCLLQ